MTSQYRRGADFERQLKKHLESKGYFVVRSAGSKGLVDLVAFPPRVSMTWDGAVFIQCKLTGKITKAEIKALEDLADMYGAAAIVATPQNFKEIWRD